MSPAHADKNFLKGMAKESFYHLADTGIKTNAVWYEAFDNLDFRVYVENVFNINYRNYLNRLRFFASEVGRISGIELNYSF